jgi:hypothetical protein
VTSLVRSGQPDGDIDALRARLTNRQSALDDRAARVVRIKSELDAFRIRYRREVGTLHDQLEELEQAIAEAELGEISKRLEDEGVEEPSTATPVSEAAPRFTSDAVRRLFRDVAKTIHPDLARDEQTRDRRHALMVEANKAYASGDEERLRRILQAWENSPEAVQGDDPESERLRLARRIAQVEDQIVLLDGDLAELTETALFKLKTMVDEAAERGKDLIGDQVRRLKRDVMAARNRLDAMTWQP